MYNVTLEQHNVNEKCYFQCPVCEDFLEVKTSKKNKPYLVCNDCGMQLFIRGEKGIKRFNKIKLYKFNLNHI